MFNSKNMINTNSQKIDEILTRGVEDVIVREDLKKKMMSGQKIRLYFGVDPTGSDLHIGHAVALWKLRDFQELGHEVILLIGDFTARIGDPSGRDTTRRPLTSKEVKENFKNYKKQASKILNFSKVKVVYNSKWLSKLTFEDILKLSGSFTVQQMIQREMFQRRLNSDLPISLQEFMYPLMQGYDSVALNVDLEIGGNDQMFNMLAGRTLQKIYNNRDKNIITLKLLLGTDGQKMSKSFGNFISINDSANDMFGKVMSIKDELMNDYFEISTRLPNDRIKEIKDSSDNPRDIKAKLAKEIVSMYHGEKEAERAEKEFNKIFKNKELPSDIEIFETSKNIYNIVDLLCDTKLASSKNEAKRLVEQNAVEIINSENKEKVNNWGAQINLENNTILKVGSRKFIKINLK